jgi:hypothetical protein
VPDVTWAPAKAVAPKARTQAIGRGRSMNVELVWGRK